MYQARFGYDVDSKAKPSNSSELDKENRLEVKRKLSAHEPKLCSAANWRLAYFRSIFKKGLTDDDSVCVNVCVCVSLWTCSIWAKATKTFSAPLFLSFHAIVSRRSADCTTFNMKHIHTFDGLCYICMWVCASVCSLGLGLVRWETMRRKRITCLRRIYCCGRCFYWCRCCIIVFARFVCEMSDKHKFVIVGVFDII